MADTIGDLIDKLSIVNCRLWHLEDERRELAVQKDSKEIHKKAKDISCKIFSSNKERNSLIDQTNAVFRVLIDACSKNKSLFLLTAEDLLGTRKNKFYKTEDL
ncbi:MAG TPA: hypothetical protein VMZ91_05900 [Candidatus Paceibacterota bacterium]|nr:hypothetical protein [Candidatus Paceibacterota bacterium]